MTTYFDRLPVELLHMVFKFLSNCDVAWAFFGVSPYLNAVLNEYHWHRLNFKSIPKTRFDFICNYLNLENVISLVLSDDIKTPGQIQLFFNQFCLSDLINLRSLTLLSITSNDIYHILSDLPKLKHLHTLVTECRTSKPLLLGHILNQLKSLQNLSVSHGDIFDHTVALPIRNLRMLDAGMCNFLELRRLQMIVPSLISLKINLHANHQLQLLSDLDIWSSMKRLNITLSGETITTFHEIEQLINHFHNLLYLTLKFRGAATDLANGYNWETCPRIIQLRKLNFNIEFERPLNEKSDEVNDIIQSFSTIFWCEVKQWHVVVTHRNIYTTSCFNDQLFVNPTELPLSTSFDSFWFYSQTKRIDLDKSISTVNLHRFHNLERLSLADECILLSIHSINKFIRLRHLIVHDNISTEILGNILTQNPQIDHLTLAKDNFRHLYQLKTIHYLHLQNSIVVSTQAQIKQINRIFPYVQRLFVNLNSVGLICQIISDFHHLDNGVFQFPHRIKPVTFEWLKRNTHIRNRTCSFTCRNESNRFLLWISNKSMLANTLTQKDGATVVNVSQECQSDKCSLQ